MFRKIVNWNREWEQELLDVLEQPSLAALTPPGYRRHLADKIAQLSLIERQQMRAFSIAYRGSRGFTAIGKLILLFTAGGIALHAALPSSSWGGAIFMANLLGFAIATATTGAWFNYRWLAHRKARIFVYLLAGATCGALMMAAASVVFGGRPVATVLEGLPRALLFGGLGAITLVVVPLLIISVLRNRDYEALTVQLQRDAERDRLARELSESQLRLMRAQIEPHFLFNTLGAVQQLAQQGAPRAAELTANLITFLRASLTEMRSEQVSLQQEFGLVEAYLQVMKARLGERLHFTLDLPDALAPLTVPSMILLTLAENAIKHGIEPSLRGGTVAISARQQDGVARIRVQNTGVGLSQEPGAGVGLENVRRRLQLVHGDAAGLTLHDAEPGVAADVTVPMATAKA